MQVIDREPNLNSQTLPSTPPMVTIVGPTASGKTALSIELAKRFNGEIICADSRTVYKYLDIGAAKPTKLEQETVPHHLLDIVSPDEQFTAADFKRLANEAIDEISSRHKLPIMVGGSGLYIDAVLFDYGFSDNAQERDPANPRHLSKAVPRVRQPARDNTLIIGMQVPREVLKDRIIKRVDGMVAAGFIEEVQWLIANYPGSKALLAPGYKAFTHHISGRISQEEAKQLFIKNDHQLAKRQMTWFKRNKSIHWISGSEQAFDLVQDFMDKKT